MAGLRELSEKYPAVNLLAISVDSPETSRTFAQKIASDGKGEVSFPLLSDPDHAVIDRYGLRDPHYQGTKIEGIPHPSVFVLNLHGTIVWKQIEEDYRQRPTLEEIERAIGLAEQP